MATITIPVTKDDGSTDSTDVIALGNHTPLSTLAALIGDPLGRPVRSAASAVANRLRHTPEIRRVMAQPVATGSKFGKPHGSPKGLPDGAKVG